MQLTGLTYRVLTWNISLGPMNVPFGLVARDPFARPSLSDAALSLPAAALGPGAWTVCLSVARALVAPSALPALLSPSDELTAPSYPDCVTITVLPDQTFVYAPPSNNVCLALCASSVEY